MKTLHLGDCLDVLRGMEDSSVDAVVTDPPYGLSFMGKKWDYDVPAVEVWAECLRVLKPGGHLLAFAGTRTQHRMAVRIEDAGFEIRDMIAWVYGSGFPKSLDVSKAIDKAAGAERGTEYEPNHKNGTFGKGMGGGKHGAQSDPPVTDAARQWQGWGTALKPAIETVTFASKPYTDKQELDIIQSNLFRLEARLWLLSPVSAAVKSSTSSQSEFDAACVIAQWSAGEITSTRADLCALMDMSLFELATNTSLSIVSSWRRTLAESWSDGNTFTTETKSSTTTDLKTLKFSLSQITPASIIKACSLPGGFNANASIAESHFNASLLLLQSIHTLSVTEPAISQEAENCRGADVKPNLDPCIMARKPLIGTVAENVLRHGTGGINVDACRVGIDPGDLDQMQGRSGKRTAPHLLKGMPATSWEPTASGRWPANLIHDGGEEVVGLFPKADSARSNGNPNNPKRGTNHIATSYGQGDGKVTHDYRDTGTAARFFQQCKVGYNEAWQDLNLPLESASTAEQSSSQQRQAAVSALVLAVNSALPEGLLCSGLLMAPSTSATGSELRLIADSVTQTIQSIGSRFWRESKPARLTLSLSHASDAEIQRLTDTTTITVNRWKSDGSAEPVTFSITPMSLGAGVKDCEQSTENRRFIYCAKASKSDRGTDNTHPTVKPTDLMRYLCRLVTPPGGVVLDPFMGSGSTGKAALLEGFKFVGIERDPTYFEIANARIKGDKQMSLLDDCCL